MTVMVQTTTNYNAVGKIVSVIVCRVPVEDKLTPTDACDPCPDCNCGRLNRVAAAEVGPRDLTPQEQQLMHGALMASSIELRSRIEIVATIERCAQVAEMMHEREFRGNAIATAIRALKDKEP